MVESLPSICKALGLERKRGRKEGRKEFKGREEIKRERKIKQKSTMKGGCTLIQESLSFTWVWILF